MLDDVPSELDKMIAGISKLMIYLILKIKTLLLIFKGALEDQNGKKDINKIDNLLNTIHNENQ